MGQFRVEVTAAGGHGCDRHVNDGGAVYGCGYISCPDCLAREFVAALSRRGIQVENATITHWPGTPSQVVDDLVTKVRRGSFNR